MTSQISLRKLEKGEVKLFRALRLQALQEAPYAFDESYEDAIQKNEAYWLELFSGLVPPHKNIMLVAEKEEKIVGFVYGFKRGESLGSFGGMWVAKSERKQGVATELIQGILIWAKGASLTELKIWNSKGNLPAQKLYEKNGFRRTGEEKILKSGMLIVRLSRKLLTD